MSIVDSLRETICEEEKARKSGGNLEAALEKYHDMVKRHILVPRENQLVLDSLEFRKNSNFF